MTWFALKYYNGKMSNWHICQECWSEDTRMDVIGRALAFNAKVHDPEQLIDMARWHSVKIEDFAGTDFAELYCSHCDEYETNPEYEMDAEEMLPDAIYDLRYMAAKKKKPEDSPKYFQATPEGSNVKTSKKFSKLRSITYRAPEDAEPIVLDEVIDW